MSSQAFQAAFIAHALEVPPSVWRDIAKAAKPVIATLFFDLYSMTDPVIASAAPALGNAFFTLFGATG